MRFYLSTHCHLKLLETPCVYGTVNDELYDLDPEAFEFLKLCSRPGGHEAGISEFTDFCVDEGILSTDPVDMRRATLEQAPSPSLRYLELQITRRCNLRCRHCYIGPPEPEELSVDEIRSVLEEFERLQGLRLILTGGEPLLHQDFEAINEMLPGLAMRKILLTNGLMATRNRLESLNVDQIQVSVDGMEEAHDAMRGPGSYRKAMECLENVLHLGFDASVSTMVHAKNLDDFKAMDRMFREMGVRDWTVDVPCPEGNLTDNPEFALSPREGGKYLEYGFGDGLHGGGAGFACGLHLMSVMADGSCARCAFYDQTPSGTIRDGLASSWANIKPITLDELACDCKHIDACRGGCRYRAETLGDPLGKDLYRCNLYGIE